MNLLTHLDWMPTRKHDCHNRYGKVAVELEEDVVDLMDVSVYDAAARTGDLLALACFSATRCLQAAASTRRGRAAARGRLQGVGVYAGNRRGPRVGQGAGLYRGRQETIGLFAK